MPSINTKEKAVYVAVSVAACAGCLMGAGSLLLYQRLRNDARGFVEPLRRDLVALRRELDDLHRLVDNLKEFRPPTSNQAALGAVAAGEEIADALYQQHVAERPSSGSGSSSRDDDIAEFYDARSDELTTDYDSINLAHSISNGDVSLSIDNLESLYKRTDILMATDNVEAIEDRRQAYDMMKQYFTQNRSNYDYLWRLSRATYMYGKALTNKDEAKRKELCFEAKDYAFNALKLNEDDADVHKWCALTIGTIGDFVSISQKLKDGWTFKVHIDQAIKLRSDDATLHHLSGRWLFGVADLGWLERKLANAIFSNVPCATYDEALVEFLKANRLKPQWKENILFIVRCYHNQGKKVDAKEWLENARGMQAISVDDAAAEKEMEQLWQSYYKN